MLQISVVALHALSFQFAFVSPKNSSSQLLSYFCWKEIFKQVLLLEISHNFPLFQEFLFFIFIFLSYLIPGTFWQLGIFFK